MEIKIQCDCGQKFKFDVEPVNGRMPWEVNCPVCGASGTDKANQVIARGGAAPLAAPLPPIGSVSSAPAASIAAPAPTAVPVAAPVAAPVPTAEAPKPRLVLSRPAHAPSPPPVAAQPAVPRPVPRQFAAAAVEKEPPSTNSLFFRGVLGAFVGALVGMGIWYGIVVATEREFVIVAWGVGALTGLGARLLAREGNTALGVVSAIFAAIAIVGGGTRAVHHMFAADLASISHETSPHEIYTNSVKEAQEAGPLDTDAQVKTFLAKREEVGESEITAEDVASFKQDELPEMKELASGQLTEQEYTKRHHTESNVTSGVVSAIGWGVAFIANLFSIWTILLLLLGCYSAYKIGAAVDD